MLKFLQDVLFTVFFHCTTTDKFYISIVLCIQRHIYNQKEKVTLPSLVSIYICNLRMIITKKYLQQHVQLLSFRQQLNLELFLIDQFGLNFRPSYLIKMLIVCNVLKRIQKCMHVISNRPYTERISMSENCIIDNAHCIVSIF